MIVSAIVAVAHKNAMGRNNDIPWHLPADLKYFKASTLNHHIIMGRKTFQSIGRPLPKRTNIVITRQPFFIASGTIICNNIEQALEKAYDNGEEEAFIIGGAQIYEASMEYWDRLYLTKVDLAVDGADTFFPEIDFSKWNLKVDDPQLPDEKNLHPYTFQIYEKK